MSGPFGYSEFIKFFEVDDPTCWEVVFQIKPDGIWVVSPPDDAFLFPEERSVLTLHPTGNLLEPALKFPCSPSELRHFLMEYGLGEIDLLKTDEDSGATPTPKEGISGTWMEHARKIADECFARDTANKCRDSLAGYSSRVMDEMQKQNIHGPRGRITNPNTIQRDALQGKKWWARKDK